MESALRSFHARHSTDPTVAICSLNDIAFLEACGMDDLYQSKALCIKCLTGPLSSWVPICALLSNVNFLETAARNHHPQWRLCLSTAFARAATALKHYTTTCLSDPMKVTEADIYMFPVLARRMRLSARRAAVIPSEVSEGDTNPVALAKKILNDTYKALMGLLRAKCFVPTIHRALATLLTEQWRLAPVAVVIPVSPQDLNLWASACSKEQATTLYTYYAMHNIQKGNLRVAEDALAKAFVCSQGNSAEGGRGVILSLWSAVNLTRGHIPSTNALREYKVVEYHGIVLAMQSGRLDVFDNAVACHKTAFAGKGVLFPVMKMRMIVARNFIIQHYRSDATSQEKSTVNLHDLFEKAQQRGMDDVFDSIEEMRDHHIIPLLLQNYISGNVSLGNNVMKLNTKAEPFPEIPLETEIPMQPQEPQEVDAAALGE